MEKKKYHDPFLEKRLIKYDKWLKKGKISFSSKVIPVSESITPNQWILPTEQVMFILINAKSVAVQNCECRSHYKRCDNPLEVCFLLNDVGDKLVSKGMARNVLMTEAIKILRMANKRGLVHLSLYRPDHEIYALCSCCSCCCHDLQIIKHFGRKELMVRSEYAAETVLKSCIHCGICIERCVFGARVNVNGIMQYNPEACMGCGLCVTTCPVGATSMVIRKR